MSSINQLYQELIIDHGRRPRNFTTNENANRILEGFNPLCGDRLTVYLTEKNGVLEDISFQGTGCAISVASASLMSEILRGKSIAEAEALFEIFHELVTKGANNAEEEKLGKLIVMAGVSEFPARVKCATLAWHTLMGAMHDTQQTVSTE